MEYEIKWLGKKYLLIGTKEEGAIATKEQFDNFETSTAHLKQGKIYCYGLVTGKIEDIAFLDK